VFPFRTARRSIAAALCAATLALGASDVLPVEPAQAASRRDVDGDKIPNGRDRDVDGDGKRNGRDRDVDGDRKRNGKDPDVDGDGKRNGKDPDVDGDGKRNGRDPDVDGDRMRNGKDTDVDGDGDGNTNDRDVDGDRLPNGSDRDIDADRKPNGTDRDMDGDERLNGKDVDMDGDAVPNHSDHDTDSSGNDQGGAPTVVPRGFFGVVAPDAFADPFNRAEQVLGDIRASGTRTIRQPFHWSHIERAPGLYDFSQYDRLMTSLVRRGLEVHPVLTDAPRFFSSAPRGTPLNRVYPPTSNPAFSSFAKAIAARYGNNGSFWRERSDLPRRPIRVWQVWNEPNVPAFWASGPDPAAYGRMLREVSRGLKRGDPKAEVLSAGLSFSTLGMAPEEFVPKMYAAARGHIDSAGVHAYAVGPDLVTDVVERMRGILTQVGDGGRAIRVSETGWGTGGPASQSLNVGPEAQGLLVKSTFERFARMRHRLGVRSVVLYSWRNLPAVGAQRDYWGLHAGLTDGHGRPKSGLSGFVESLRALER